MRSNKSGPIIFGGNTLLKKDAKPKLEDPSEVLSKAEYQKPMGKVKNIKDLDFDD